MSQSDQRFVALQAWLTPLFEQPFEIRLISGDASFRRYFRVTLTAQQNQVSQASPHHVEQARLNATSYIVADSPVELVPIEPFIAMAEAYKQAGLLVPEVIASDAQQGFVLQTDLGDEQLLSHLTPQTVTQYYQQALALLPSIAGVTQTAQGELAQFDEAFLRRELGIFTEWLLECHLNYQPSDQESTLIENTNKVLIASALEQPQVGMHRDFHSRNLLLTEQESSDSKLAVIDFQDAVIGPVTYDAVSLLRDCYIRWPDELVNPLMQSHFDAMQAAGVIEKQTTFSRYQRWFDLMGLQRHIKAAGIFTRLKHRDGKTGYIKDIPLTLQYIVDISARYVELAEFGQWLEANIVPRFACAKEQVCLENSKSIADEASV
ncbi:aminoglycoside phosphotransferase [Shewanella maritima]|uniref:Aminoglycoside phosphotransferase n=1 Tax=Shewanella maritima TaxID=2520507 RepID=A0A411PFD2_9GAMM|nr:phosphotransferase [Shewanella maritima]QBF82263.1 aminoglycoside phosphotransferase [Shewanella maritima]